MMKPRLVLCSGSSVSTHSPLRNGRRVIELDTLNPDCNTHLLINNVTDTFARDLQGRFVDLLEIATYVYTADCEASRELAWGEDKSAEPWSRDFHFVIPVRDLSFWQRPQVCKILVSALGFLSSDRFEFDFCQLQHERTTEPYLEIGDEDLAPFKGLDHVTMFSGGLDSLAGAVQEARQGNPLVLVSHRPAPQMNKRQRELFARLRDKFAVPMMHIPVRVNKSGHDSESTQRTRSFLFSALGAAVASVLGARGVRFYENGVISLNWPLAAEVQQSRASRTTHPEALKRLQDFHRLLSDSSITNIDNPYIFKTKTEVVNVIAESGAEDLIAYSCSCAHTIFQSKSQRHCGYCGQCIDRRIAIQAAGLEDWEVADDYVSDVFTGPRPVNRDRPYDHNIAVDYVRFAADLHRMDAEDIAREYNKELARAVRYSPRPSEAADEFLAMHKRHAATVLDVLGKVLRLNSNAFVSGDVEQTSLLGIIGRGEHLGLPVYSDDAVLGHLASDNNVFRKMGDYWTISYGGTQVHVKDMKGLRYIEFLLRNRNEDGYLALHLVMQVSGQLPEPDEIYSSMSADELAEEGLNTIGFSDEELDKARSSVTHAIRSVLKKLSEDHPVLHDHLDASLSLGRKVSYRPTSPTTWQL